MAKAADVLNTIRRNRSAWFIRRQLTQTQHVVQTVLPQQIENNTDLAYSLGNPSLAPDPDPTPQSDYWTSETLNGRWGWLNQGSATAVIRNKRLLLTVPATGNPAVNNAVMLVQPLPWANLPIAGTFSMRTAVQLNNKSDNLGGGLVVRCGPTGAFITWASVQTGDSGTKPYQSRWIQLRWSSYSTPVVSSFDLNPASDGQPIVYLQLRCDGSTFYYDFSADNNLYRNVATSSVGSLSGTPDNFGIYGNAPAASEAATPTFSPFRVYYDALLNRP